MGLTSERNDPFPPSDEAPGRFGLSLRKKFHSAGIAAHHTAVAQYVTVDLFQQLGAGQPGGQGFRRQVQGVDLDDVVVRAVTHRRARAHIGSTVAAVEAGQPFQVRLVAGTGGNLPGGGLDAVVHPVIHALALGPVRVVHDDGVAQGPGRAGGPVQGRGIIVPATALGIAGIARGEQPVIRNPGNVQGKTLLGLHGQVQAQQRGTNGQPSIAGGKARHTKAPYLRMRSG